METLFAAYGDGQLTLEEYEQRVEGVLAADNAWRLERWVNDLQVPETPEPRSTWRSRLAARTAPLREGVRDGWRALRDDWRRYPRAARVAIAGAALVVLGGSGAAVILDAVRGDSAVVAQQQVTTGLAEFREAYETEFGTTLVSRVQLDRGDDDVRGDYVQVDQPVAFDPPRVQEWGWRGSSFSAVGDVRGATYGVVDLAEVDVDAVEAALRRGVAELGLPEASKVTTIIAPRLTGEDGEERITLVLRNDFEEEARLTTDFAGRELDRTPFVDPKEG